MSNNITKAFNDVIDKADIEGASKDAARQALVSFSESVSSEGADVQAAYDKLIDDLTAAGVSNPALIKVKLDENSVNDTTREII